MSSKKYPVNLPQTSFSMKADLAQKEPVWLESWAKADLYRKALAARAGSAKYILHDGPPYANGPIHMGHALNKTLKDIIVRYKTLAGFQAPYVPGWDCHGLPIEQALLKELKISKKEAAADPVAFRKKCREFVLRMVEVQKKDFVRLGILGDWDNPYITMEPPYASKIVEAFIRLYQQGYIYKGLKPVYWCLHCETALAQAEIEYKEKTSPSIYVAFPIEGKPDYSVLIWTTTPWTLPANRAAVVHPKAVYAVIELDDGRRVIVAERLKDRLAQLLGGRFSGETFTAAQMSGWTLASPLAKRSVPVIADEEVSLEEGTGIVHSAPGHGDIDFLWGQRFKLEVASPVNETGAFTPEAGWAELTGRRVSEEETTRLLLSLLGQRLLSSSTTTHSYPHCWRCKNPVIFRATEQWFLSIEHNDLRRKILAAIEETAWLPPGSKERIRSMVGLRPDWCLSRQRIWGAPIPILYCKSCNRINDEKKLFEVLVAKIAAEGEDFWFDPAGVFLNDLGERFPCACGSRQFVRDANILDVWMDSGVSWFAVAQAQEALAYPADIYLEGSDQHRGWFQTSIITAAALTGRAPYRAVYTNGWVLDEQGRAMHKSLGNVVSPQDIVQKWGADVLRLWAASTASIEDVRISPRLMELYADHYRKLRNTLRFILGNCHGFDPHRHGVPTWDHLERFERWALSDLNGVIKECREGYETQDFPRVLRALLKFSIHDLSNFYFDISKDRLYTFKPDDPDRRATQSVLFVIGHYLIAMLAPICPFTAEEAYAELLALCSQREPAMLANVKLPFPEAAHLLKFPIACADWDDDDLKQQTPIILAIRETVHKKLDEMRKDGILGSSLQAKVAVEVSRKNYGVLRLWQSFLSTVLMVSDVDLKEGPVDDDKSAVTVSKTEGAKCERCWIYHPSVGSDPRDPNLCPKCVSVLYAKEAVGEK
ncbi:MAG: isoleucine--tRNA ligase [Elusimicrobia bacterium]|nr:isoleucine--tRNA ligase [Elusimicrobiota bacterium]